VPDVDDLHRRVRLLEGLLLRPRPAPRTPHHPRPGSWDADTRHAQCRYCLQGIEQDQRGRWTCPGQQQGDKGHCQARANGAPEHDENGPIQPVESK
jgi:hypothetical protein